MCFRLVTKTQRVVETGRDDASVPFDSSYGSFRCSLNLNVDFCCKNVGTLEQSMQGEAKVSMLICDSTVIWCHLLV